MNERPTLSRLSFRAFLATFLMCLHAPADAATSLVAWGRNDTGQSTVPTNLPDVVAVAAARNYAVALRENGTLAGWGDLNGDWTNAVSRFDDIVAIDAMYQIGLLLRRNGTVVAFNSTGDFDIHVPADLTNATAIAASVSHALALRADGSVTAWNLFAPGPLAAPAGLTNVIAIAAGSAHSVALTGEGRVVAWGDNQLRQIDVPAGLNEVVAIEAGWSHTVALRRNGTVVSWGNNQFGQLKLPSTSIIKTVAIAAGGYHSLGLWESGTVLASGRNNDGQSAVPPLANVVKIAAGMDNSIALQNDGRPFMLKPNSRRLAYRGNTVHLDGRATGAARPRYQWKFQGLDLPRETNAFLTVSNAAPEQSGAYSVTAFNAAGDSATTDVQLEILDSPPVMLIQSRANPVTFIGSRVILSGLVQGSRPMAYQWFRDAVAIPGGTNSDLVLNRVSRADGGAYSLRATNAMGVATSQSIPVIPVPVALWGRNVDWESELTPALSNVVAASAGRYFGLGLTSEGRVVAWGENSQGQTNVPAEATNIVAIAAGDDFSAAVREGGALICWGRDIGTSHLALSNVISIACGNRYGLALLPDGRVRGFGAPLFGSSTNIPPEATNVVAVVCGSSSSYALTHDGRVLAWGPDNSGQTKVVPEGLTNVVSLAAGSAFVLAVRATGQVVGWGQDTSGQASAPSLLNDIAGVAAGFQHSIAVRRDGSVVAWGGNLNAQVEVPQFLNGVTSIDAGGDFSVAVIDEDFERYGMVELFEPHLTGAGVSLSVPTRRGHTYWLEASASLEGSRWRRIQGAAGNGSRITLSDPTPDDGERYYRVRRQ